MLQRRCFLQSSLSYIGPSNELPFIISPSISSLILKAFSFSILLQDTKTLNKTVTTKGWKGEAERR